MATAGTPIRALKTPFKNRLPLKLPRPRKTPRGIDQHDAKSVASPDTAMVLMAISRSPLSPVNINMKASPRPWRITDAIGGTSFL